MCICLYCPLCFLWLWLSCTLFSFSWDLPHLFWALLSVKFFFSHYGSTCFNFFHDDMLMLTFTGGQEEMVPASKKSTRIFVARIPLSVTEEDFHRFIFFLWSFMTTSFLLLFFHAQQVYILCPSWCHIIILWQCNIVLFDCQKFDRL